jgi:hypothetical protein
MAEVPAIGKVGDFASYVYAVISTVGANPGLVTWLDTTLPAAMNARTRCGRTTASSR